MSMLTPEQAEALRDLRKRLPEGLQNREEHDGASDLARLRDILNTQEEADDWYASRPSPHGGIIAGHVTFAQWDLDGDLIAFGLIMDEAEYLVQPIDPSADGDEEDDES